MFSEHSIFYVRKPIKFANPANRVVPDITNNTLLFNKDVWLIVLFEFVYKNCLVESLFTIPVLIKYTQIDILKTIYPIETLSATENKDN